MFYGVREHAMGSISNGIATYNGMLPFTATFFTFSDYIRPTFRLAPMMHLNSFISLLMIVLVSEKMAQPMNQ